MALPHRYGDPLPLPTLLHCFGSGLSIDTGSAFGAPDLNHILNWSCNWHQLVRLAHTPVKES